jgi:hypothetical protein
MLRMPWLQTFARGAVATWREIDRITLEAARRGAVRPIDLG